MARARINKINVGILGVFQNGKSTFVNCLLDDLVARTGGYGLSVTSINTTYQYGIVQNVAYRSDKDVICNSRLADFLTCEAYPQNTQKIVVSLWKPILDNVNIIDTPGFNANDKDSAMAFSSLEEIDIAVLIIDNKDISSTELEVLSLLKKYHIPFFVIMNCKNHMGNSWMPKSPFNENIAKNNLERIHQKGLRPIIIDKEEIWQTNLLWFWFASEQYLSESPDKQESYTEDIEHFYNKQKRNLSKKEFCLNYSNFLPIRSIFTNSIWYNFPLTFTRWQKNIDEIFENWESKIIK